MDGSGPQMRKRLFVPFSEALTIWLFDSISTALPPYWGITTDKG